MAKKKKNTKKSTKKHFSQTGTQVPGTYAGNTLGRDRAGVSTAAKRRNRDAVYNRAEKRRKELAAKGNKASIELGKVKKKKNK
tara:strand:+ start:395 stop:643 length:249 start_codon:yes stop_codon:yes gene_type:complete